MDARYQSTKSLPDFRINSPYCMKVIASILVITLKLLFFSCAQSNPPKALSINHKDSSNTLVKKKEQELVKIHGRIEEQEKIDSINDGKILNQALRIAEQFIAQNKFKKKYVATPPDSSCQVDVDLNCGFYFTREFPHLIIKRRTPASVYIDIYSKFDKQFQKVLSHEQWKMEYTGDTIRDINGDNLKDFVVNWYGSNGCCLKAFSNVYLQRSNNLSFSKSFEFINPTFSSKEKIIRGVCYGHPGETEMYKYKWNQEAVDTVEFIYYEKNRRGEKTGKLIISNNRPYSTNNKILKRLNYVPAEYRRIMGYDWFIDNLDQNANH